MYVELLANWTRQFPHIQNRLVVYFPVVLLDLLHDQLIYLRANVPEISVVSLLRVVKEKVPLRLLNADVGQFV